MANLSKKITKKGQKEIGTLNGYNNKSTLPGEETIKLLLETHFPKHTPMTGIRYDRVGQTEMKAVDEKYKEWISKELVNIAFDGFKDGKSAGPDGFKPIVFKNLPDNMLDYITSIYWSCIHLQYTPRRWKETKVIFISKPGKDTYTDPKAFRPISLSNYLLKGFEKLAVWRMDKKLREHPLHEK
jgi:hypothetical protein